MTEHYLMDTITAAVDELRRIADAVARIAACQPGASDLADAHELIDDRDSEIKALREEHRSELMMALGWMHAEACVAADKGQDIRSADLAEMIARFRRDCAKAQGMLERRGGCHANNG